MTAELPPTGIRHARWCGELDDAAVLDEWASAVRAGLRWLWWQRCARCGALGLTVGAT